MHIFPNVISDFCCKKKNYAIVSQKITWIFCLNILQVWKPSAHLRTNSHPTKQKAPNPVLRCPGPWRALYACRQSETVSIEGTRVRRTEWLRYDIFDMFSCSIYDSDDKTYLFVIYFLSKNEFKLFNITGKKSFRLKFCGKHAILKQLWNNKYIPISSFSHRGGFCQPEQ